MKPLAKSVLGRLESTWEPGTNEGDPLPGEENLVDGNIGRSRCLKSR